MDVLGLHRSEQKLLSGCGARASHLVAPVVGARAAAAWASVIEASGPRGWALWAPQRWLRSWGT